MLQRLGLKLLPVTMSPGNAAKLVFDHGMLSREMKTLADAMADLVAVVDSESSSAPAGSLVVITDLVKSNGQPVIAAIHPDKGCGASRLKRSRASSEAQRRGEHGALAGKQPALRQP